MRGGRGRGGREGEGRGRRGERENLPPLAASLSAPGLGTKGGTLMNSPPSPRTPGYLSLATLPPRLSALSGHTKVPARLAGCIGGRLWKVRPSGKKVSGDCCLVYLSCPECARLPALGVQRSRPVTKFGWKVVPPFPRSLLFCSLTNLNR